MWRLAIAAVAVAAFVQPASAQTRQLELLAAEMSICKALVKHDADEARRCVADVQRGLDAEQARLETALAKQTTARAFLEKHGVTDPDIDAKYQVARRQGILFAVILSECWRKQGGADAMAHCLDQREKEETWLGNAMDTPQ